jgi:hypothetical protein
MEVMCLYIITIASLLYIGKNVYSAIKEDEEDLKPRRRR